MTRRYLVSGRVQGVGYRFARGPRPAHVTGVVAEPAQVTESFTTFSTR